MHLREGALGVRHQHEPEPADHPVEGQTFEGEALGIHLVELRVPHAEGARPGTGPPQHGRGEVHARYQAARPHAAGDGEGRLARSGGHVQHPHARTDPGQLDQPAAERTELRQDNVGVATGELIPHLPFVLLVGLALRGHWLPLRQCHSEQREESQTRSFTSFRMTALRSG